MCSLARANRTCRESSGSMRLLIAVSVLLSLPSASVATTVTIDPSYTSNQNVRRSIQGVADDIWLIVQDMFRSAPPLDLPIECRREDIPRPFTHLDNWSHPTKIVVELTVAETLDGRFGYA